MRTRTLFTVAVVVLLCDLGVVGRVAIALWGVLYAYGLLGLERRLFSTRVRVGSFALGWYTGGGTNFAGPYYRPEDDLARVGRLFVTWRRR